MALLLSLIPFFLILGVCLTPLLWRMIRRRGVPVRFFARGVGFVLGAFMLTFFVGYTFGVDLLYCTMASMLGAAVVAGRVRLTPPPITAAGAQMDGHTQRAGDPLLPLSDVGTCVVQHWRTHSRITWKPVSADEASRHPLYGRGGWLTIFAIVLGAGLLTDLASIMTAATAARRSLGAFLGLARYNPEISFLRLTLTTEVLAVCAIYWLLFSKHRYFRAGTIILLLGLWPAEALLGVWNPFPKLADVLGEAFAQWAIGCAIWVAYLQRSERVRVTFEHMVRAERSHACANDSHLRPPQPGVSGKDDAG